MDKQQFMEELHDSFLPRAEQHVEEVMDSENKVLALYLMVSSATSIIRDGVLHRFVDDAERLCLTQTVAHLRVLRDVMHDIVDCPYNRAHNGEAVTMESIVLGGMKDMVRMTASYCLEHEQELKATAPSGSGHIPTWMWVHDYQAKRFVDAKLDVITEALELLKTINITV